MDHHLLQYTNSEHSRLMDGTDNGLDPILSSNLMSMTAYPHDTISSQSMMIHQTDGSSASLSVPPQTLYSSHLSQDMSSHPLQIFHSQTMGSLSQSSSPTTPQSAHQMFFQQPIPPHSSGMPADPLQPTPFKTPMIPTMGIRPPSPADTDGLPALNLKSGRVNKETEEPTPSRTEKMGRLGSHANASRGTVTVSGVTPVNPATKDATGKFPCQHCHKHYLHLKHLKRHLLRHTGDRPYQCVLCKDTFSRSDILKRHFQKCSIRRGNPGNLTHLTHAHDHQRKKNKGAAAASVIDDDDVSDRATSTTNGGSLRKRHKTCEHCLTNKLVCDGLPSCSKCREADVECMYNVEKHRRQSTAKQADTQGLSQFPSLLDYQQSELNSREAFNFPPPTHPHSHLRRDTGDFQSYPPGSVPLTTSPPYTPIGEEPYPPLDHTSSLPSSYGESYNYHPQNGLPEEPVKSEDGMMGPLSHSGANGMSYSNSMMYYPAQSQPQVSPTEMPDYGWPFGNDGQYFNTQTMAMQAAPNDIPFFLDDKGTGIPYLDGFMGLEPPTVHPLKAKCEHLTNLLFSNFESRLSTPESPPGQAPAPGTTDDSDLRQWLTADNVAHFVELFRKNFQAHFPLIHFSTFQLAHAYDGLVLALICHGAVYSHRGITVDQVRRLMERSISVIEQSDPLFARNFNPETSNRVISTEEMQARILFGIISTWHGNERQRDRIRRNFGKLNAMARNSCFFKPLTPRETGATGWSYYHQTDKTLKLSQEWRWEDWTEQEKRNRAMFGVYLLDAAFVIYFNEKPRIGLFDLKITLPADDAAWEASTSEDCAKALGLHGPEHQSKNITGTRTTRQPELATQLEELLTIGKEFRLGSTNAYGKFILIHAIHVYIWQKQREFGTGQWGYHHAALEPGQRLTTQQKNLEVLQFNQTVSQALEKWKRAWDADLITQYPDIKRNGFCRDGVAFYWLAVMFTRFKKKRDLVLKDVRDRQVVAQVQQMLEQVNRQPRNTYPTHEPGAASAIDKKYGVDELTFDMKLLFHPIEKEEEEDDLT